MADYTYRCSRCQTEHDHNSPIGTAPRIRKCDCGAPARLLIGAGVRIGASATPNKKSNVLNLDRSERQFAQDGPAYKRMRHRGLQPNQIDGCATLENEVGDQNDIDYSRAIKVANASGGGKERVVETVASLEVTHG